MAKGRDRTTSLWEKTAPSKPRSPLQADAEFDVVVVGAGITGATLAFELALAGKRVALIERDRIAAGVTGRTSAHLTTLPDVTYGQVIRHFGQDAAAALARGLTAAIDTIEELVNRRGIDCDFARVPGYLYAEKGQDGERVEREMSALLATGMAGTELTELPVSYEIDKALRVERQALFHPRRYLAGLCDAFEAEGGRLYETTSCVSVDDRSDHCIVRTNGGITAKAAHVVFATHTPLGTFPHHAAMRVFRSYVIAARLTGRAPEGLFLDCADPYHYLRKHSFEGRELWLVGGADHAVGHCPERDPFEELERWARERFSVEAIEASWSAQVYEPADGLPYVGRKPGSARIWFATGFQGDGLTFGTLAARVLSHGILERHHELAQLLSPKRFKLTAGIGRLVSEGFESLRGLVAHRILHPDRSALAGVPPGQGRIVRQGAAQLAVYRSPDGKLSARSAVCPHMGCIVSYNQVEKSWDCPCHGSRFDLEGRVIEGPAYGDLERAELRDVQHADREPVAHESKKSAE